MSTKGMHAVGQAEVVILLQCLPDEKTIPKDVFTHFVQLYREALSGRKPPEAVVDCVFPPPSQELEPRLTCSCRPSVADTVLFASVGLSADSDNPKKTSEAADVEIIFLPPQWPA